MLYDLLMLGDPAPQVICFALEQEVDYYAPAFRCRSDPADPMIQYREPSDTPVDRTKSKARLISDERRWAIQQIAWNRSIVCALRDISRQAAGEHPEERLPSPACLPEAIYGNI